MLILADENIPCVRGAFNALGEIRTRAGRDITSGDLRNIGLLLVRSVTHVDRTLLTGSRVRFVGSATAGTDHVDLDFLNSTGIAFAHAPGCNAQSAAEYVIAALMALNAEGELSLPGKTAGIIGCGNVGSRVTSRLEALGVRCLINDPPLAGRRGGGGFVTLDEITGADIVSVHVPLTTGGEHPTRQLLDGDFFAQLKPDAVFINTSRGEVVNEPSLKHILEGRPDLRLVLDVWTNEPNIDVELIERAAIATPHIAGYSIEGKLRGTDAIYTAACAHFGMAPAWRMEDALPVPQPPKLRLNAQANDHEILREAVLAVYDPRPDDARLRGMLSLPLEKRGALFDELRRNYPPRREFASLEIHPPLERAMLAARLQALGFHIQRP